MNGDVLIAIGLFGLLFRCTLGGVRSARSAVARPAYFWSPIFSFLATVGAQITITVVSFVFTMFRSAEATPAQRAGPEADTLALFALSLSFVTAFLALPIGFITDLGIVWPKRTRAPDDIERGEPGKPALGRRISSRAAAADQPLWDREIDIWT
jgi:hypothetical protein